MDTDRITKQILLRASQERVWQAISDSQQFGSWFGMRFDAPFIAGATMKGWLTPTKVDAEVAAMQKPYEGMAFTFQIGDIEPPRRLTFRWHPHAVDPGTDYSHEPMTLVEFVLEPRAEGTMLTITESGFDSIPLERRAKAFSSNDKGWEHQTRMIEAYLAQTA
jgi:uncharacterized protein YndB with AHSA1/START domain